MKSRAYVGIHRMKYSSGKSDRCRTHETRAIQGSRFKILLLDAGLSIDAAAQMLHVTPRTIRNWISGSVTVPYAAYKLLRVMRLFELPCTGWDGWCMHSGRLWSPEGHGFLPSDSSWWGLLVRKAALFQQMYDRDRLVNVALKNMREGNGQALGDGPSQAQRPGRAQRGPNLLLEHFRTSEAK